MKQLKSNAHYQSFVDYFGLYLSRYIFIILIFLR